MGDVFGVGGSCARGISGLRALSTANLAFALSFCCLFGTFDAVAMEAPAVEEVVAPLCQVCSHQLVAQVCNDHLLALLNIPVDSQVRVFDIASVFDFAIWQARMIESGTHPINHIAVVTSVAVGVEDRLDLLSQSHASQTSYFQGVSC